MAPFGKTPTSSNFSDTCIIFTLFIEQCINDTWVRERWELALPIETYMWSSPSYDYMNVYWPHAHRGLIHSSIWSWCDQSSHPLQCLASELFNGFLRPRMFGSKINILGPCDVTTGFINGVFLEWFNGSNHEETREKENASTIEGWWQI